VNETLPEGFTYVPDSLTGNASVYSYDETTNHLTINFRDETTVTYNVTASSHDQIPAEFSGTYKTFTAGMEVETGDVGGDTEVVVDGTLPYTDGHNPEKGATDVSVDTSITVHVKDDGAGVDHNTIVMTVESVPVMPTILPIGLTLNFSVTYDPPADFGHGQVVNVTIDASDLAGNAMITDSYSFTTDPPVTEKPDLVVTEKWVCWPDNCTICYNITNMGNGTAPADHNTTLYVDETEVAHDQVTEGLAPNASYIGCFEDAWVYTPPEDNITVCADNDGTVDESDEGNNCLTNIWMCGDVNEDKAIDLFDAVKTLNRATNPAFPLACKCQ